MGNTQRLHGLGSLRWAYEPGQTDWQLNNVPKLTLDKGAFVPTPSSSPLCLRVGVTRVTLRTAVPWNLL